MAFNEKEYFKEYRKTNLTQLSVAIPKELAAKLKFKLAEDGRRSFRSWALEQIIKYINTEIKKEDE